MRPFRISPIRLAIFGLMILLVSNLFTAISGSNQVQSTHLAEYREPITVNDFIPPECQSLTLTQIVTGSGNFKGTGRSELIVGSPGADTINALNGDDCILGGEGDDTIYGSNGNDVLVGGPGADTLSGDQGTDSCYGGAVTNSCEYTYP
jgi:Ca2+-binding RTX toxin-like protein